MGLFDVFIGILYILKILYTKADINQIYDDFKLKVNELKTDFNDLMINFEHFINLNDSSWE